MTNSFVVFACACLYLTVTCVTHVVCWCLYVAFFKLQLCSFVRSLSWTTSRALCRSFVLKHPFSCVVRSFICHLFSVFAHPQRSTKQTQHVTHNTNKEKQRNDTAMKQEGRNPKLHKQRRHKQTTLRTQKNDHKKWTIKQHVCVFVCHWCVTFDCVRVSVSIDFELCIVLFVCNLS
jgi:hypothetical protein